MRPHPCGCWGSVVLPVYSSRVFEPSLPGFPPGGFLYRADYFFFLAAAAFFLAGDAFLEGATLRFLPALKPLRDSAFPPLASAPPSPSPSPSADTPLAASSSCCLFLAALASWIPSQSSSSSASAVCAKGCCQNGQGMAGGRRQGPRRHLDAVLPRCRDASVAHTRLGTGAAAASVCKGHEHTHGLET